MFSVAAFWTFMSIGGFPSFVEDMKVPYSKPICSSSTEGQKTNCNQIFPSRRLPTQHQLSFSQNYVFVHQGVMNSPNLVQSHLWQVFQHERLSGHYGGAAFVVANTFASIPYLCLISLTSGTLVYFLSELHPGFDHYAYFIIMLFACLACVESLMMMVSSVVGENFLAGIVVGAGIQVCSHILSQTLIPVCSTPN